ncbi:MAG TPA: hypothetical protein VKB65_04590 [Myxococcota bacterium]|nr:hypothetical protein [Myxococcota bacterium]
MTRPLRSIAPAAALLAAAVAAPAAAVPVSPIAAKRVAPSASELVDEVVSDTKLAVTFGERRAPTRPAARSLGASVLLSNDPQHGFGFDLDRFRGIDTGE